MISYLVCVGGVGDRGMGAQPLEGEATFFLKSNLSLCSKSLRTSWAGDFTSRTL